MDSHLHFNPDAPPPSYPGSDVHPISAHFHPPSFNDVMVSYGYEDSIRLPTYQARPIRRYHPYWRSRPAIPPQVDDGIRYLNTIFDESYVELEVPPFVPRTVRRVPTPYQTAPTEVALAETDGHRIETFIPPASLVLPLPPIPTVHEQNAQENMEEQHRQRVQRLWYLIPEFVTTVRRALAVASGVAEPRLAPTHSSPPGGRFILVLQIESQAAELPAIPALEDVEPAPAADPSHSSE